MQTPAGARRVYNLFFLAGNIAPLCLEEKLEALDTAFDYNTCVPYSSGINIVAPCIRNRQCHIR